MHQIILLIWCNSFLQNTHFLVLHSSEHVDNFAINFQDMNKQRKNKLSTFLGFLICILMVAAASIRRDGKLLGHEFGKDSAQAVSAKNDTIRKLADGTVVVNTTGLGKDIAGYGGTVPLEIYIKGDVIQQVKALPNHETEEFFDMAKTLLTRWNGKTVAEASAMKVDGVSGATFSSRGILGNMRVGLQYAAKQQEKRSIFADFDLSVKNICGLIVALLAATLPLFIKNRRYRLFQQILNITVLGFWCGTFMSWSSILGYMSNGMNVIALLLPTLLLIMAFIYPLFGKKNYYCTNVCPYGCVQELIGKNVKYKVKISSKTIKRLNTFRKVLFAVLMLCLWTGVWSDWVDYEPYSAFIFQSASWIVIAIAVAFALLSTIVMRPYCRFVCPMGTLFKVEG